MIILWLLISGIVQRLQIRTLWKHQFFAVPIRCKNYSQRQSWLLYKHWPYETRTAYIKIILQRIQKHKRESYTGDYNIKSLFPCFYASGFHRLTVADKNRHLHFLEEDIKNMTIKVNAVIYWCVDSGNFDFVRRFLSTCIFRQEG